MINMLLCSRFQLIPLTFVEKCRLHLTFVRCHTWLKILLTILTGAILMMT